MSPPFGDAEEEFARSREAMVDRLRRDGYVRSEAVAGVMRSVPRHRFMPADRARLAYVDSPVEIGEGQTISAPHMVAMMLERLELCPGLKVLEIGGGSGYHAACIAGLVRPGGRVWSVEYIGALAAGARSRLAAVGIPEAEAMVVEGDGSLGLPDACPFERILVTCAAPEVPPPLLSQLAAPGILIAPVGSRSLQSLIVVRKDRERRLRREDHGGCMFVPLRGRFGFD